jgi:hypothetical protein
MDEIAKSLFHGTEVSKGAFYCTVDGEIKIKNIGIRFFTDSLSTESRVYVAI